MKAPAVLCLVLCLALPAAAQTLYKWVDEKGVTQYSDKPPPDEKKASKVDIRVEPGKPAGDNWKEREQQSRQQRVEKDRAASEQKAKAEADREQRCRQAQSRIDKLKNVSRLYDLDAKGERVYIEDKDRPALLEKWQREADESCR